MHKNVRKLRQASSEDPRKKELGQISFSLTPSKLSPELVEDMFVSPVGYRNEQN